MPYCQQFKEKILKWKQELSEARVLLRKFMEGGEKEKAEEMKLILEKIQENFSILLDDFKKNVARLLQSWYSKDKADKLWILDDIVETISFDKNGRISLSGVLILRSSGFDYFPKVIKKTGVINVIGNHRLEILPNLEECNDLQAGQSSGLQSLPKLAVAKSCFLDGTNIKTLENLKEVRTLNLPRGFVCAPKLEKIDLTLNIKKTEIDDFRVAFPLLNYIGGNLWLSSFAIKQQVEELIKKQELKIDGEIKFE